MNVGARASLGERDEDGADRGAHSDRVCYFLMSRPSSGVVSQKRVRGIFAYL